MCWSSSCVWLGWEGHIPDTVWQWNFIICFESRCFTSHHWYHLIQTSDAVIKEESWVNYALPLTWVSCYLVWWCISHPLISDRNEIKHVFNERYRIFRSGFNLVNADLKLPLGYCLPWDIENGVQGHTQCLSYGQLPWLSTVNSNYEIV